jgi:MoxR-like ATPase
MTSREKTPLNHLYQDKLQNFWKAANEVILDKEKEVMLTFCSLLANGHLLIEDIPGVGKTTLVKMLSKLLGLKTSRIQFTNDLLPGDILGSSIFDPEKRSFNFYPGPIFSELILADELNRATPKTQSAFLQVMEERKVTIDGQTHSLNQPFFIIATQNPRQQIGTFSLPESQLDRFLMRIEIGHPSREAERKLLLGVSRESLLEQLKPLFNAHDLLEIQKLVSQVHISEAIVDYIQDIIAMTRTQKDAGNGLSPRGALCLVSASKAWAFLQNRNMVLPEDVQAVAIPVMSHRLNPSEDLTGETGKQRSEEILKSVLVD